MKVIKYVGLFLLGIVIIILLAALFIPTSYHVERSITIKAPKELIMQQVTSLRKMNEWSPWFERDTSMKIVYSAEEAIVGSYADWESEDEGSGRQTITNLRPDRMETRLDFREPWEGSADAFFQVEQVGGETKATWGMSGKDPYPLNIMIPFLDMMLGSDYEEGLNKLKNRCEAMIAVGY